MAKNKGGRPSKINDISFEQVKKLAALGLIDTQIADVLGICEATLNNYKQNPEFLEAIKAGKAIADEKVERSLYERACGFEHPEEKVFCSEGCIVTHQTTKKYPPDPTSIIFWLKNRKPKEWRDRVEHTGVDGGPITVKTINYAGDNTPTQV